MGTEAELLVVLLLACLVVLAIIGVRRAPPPEEEALPKAPAKKSNLKPEEDKEVGINPRKDKDGNTIYY